MPERRITCPRHHWLFSVTEQGDIAIKCRGCHEVFVQAWAELEAKRREVLQPLAQSIPVDYTTINNHSLSR